MPVDKGAQICRFHAEVAGLADASQLADVTRALLDGASGTSGLTGRQLAVAIRQAGRRLKPEADVVDDERVQRAHRGLYKSSGPVGTTTCRFVLHAEGAAVLDAAIDPLARPHDNVCVDPGCGCKAGSGGEGCDGAGHGRRRARSGWTGRPCPRSRHRPHG